MRSAKISGAKARSKIIPTGRMPGETRKEINIFLLTLSRLHTVTDSHSYFTLFFRILRKLHYKLIGTYKASFYLIFSNHLGLMVLDNNHKV